MLATILVYPNKFEYENKQTSTTKEVCTVTAGQTLDAWLQDSVPSYCESDESMFSAVLNGDFFAVEQWAIYEIKAGDVLELVVEPKGSPMVVMAVISVVAAAASIYALNQIPDNYSTTTPNGSSIYDVNVQGNRPRLMGVIPELAGTHKLFPDYLNQPKVEYIDGELWKHFMVCVGVGDHEILAENIFIGNTPVSRYAGDITYELFGPGVDVSGNGAHRNFYSTPEVGGNGLEVSAPSYKFFAEAGSGWAIRTIRSYTENEAKYDAISLLVGSDKGYVGFPWSVGDDIQLDMIVGTIEIFEGVVDLVDKGDLNPDQITAAFGLDVVTVGQKIQLAGAGGNDGTYLVKTVSAIALELTDEAGVDVTWFVPAERVLIRILEDRSILGLYHAEEPLGSNGIVLSKVGDPDWPGFGSYMNYENVSAELIGDVITPIAVGPFSAAPDAELTNLIELDFVFAGLGRLNNDGSVNAHSVDIEIQYREIGTSVWTGFPHTFTAATRDHFGETIVVSLPSKIAVEVQVERVSRQEDSINLSEKVLWTALRAELDTVTSYADVTTMAIKIRGNNSLSAGVENKLNVISSRVLPVYANGQWQSAQATDDIAAFFAYVIKDSGYGDAQIGLEEMARLNDIWIARGDTFSAVFDSGSTIFAALKRVLAVGYSEPTIDYGQILPIRDEARTDWEHMYLPENMLGIGLERDISPIQPDEKGAVEVEYFNEQGKPETVICSLPDDSLFDLEKIRAFGISDRTKAWRFGMRKRRERRYRRTQFKFKTEMDALNSRYMSFCALADDVPGYSQTGRMEWQFGRTVTLDRQLEWGEGVHYLALRKSDGTLSGPYVVTPGEEFEAVLASDLDFTPVLNGRQEPPFFMFGSAERWCFPALIKDVNPQGTSKVSVKAVNYDVRVYADDDNFPPV